MTSTNTRPAQLAPVRIGRGRVVHLGNLSSITGPAGEPRYVAGSCSAGTRGDTVKVGAAVAAPIDCRNCTHSNSVRVAWINAMVIAATSGPVTLPHTGLTVPHTQLRVDGPAHPGPGSAKQHPLYLGDRFVGWITTYRHRSATYQLNCLGGRELDEYAQQCRLYTGDSATVADVLAELVREHLTATDVAARLAASRTPVRLMQHVRDGDPYPTLHASVPVPLTTDPTWHRAAAYVLRRDHPAGPDQHWQIWTPTGWTRLPDGVDVDQDHG
ncbi:hypothetical protein [Micromonospora sp. WMMD737]|uniref:hypothetical protein n=1 Tax=Micromonospora sp. WMMD737 TaxID=3404113 RepID=UPI003B94970F